MHGKSWCCFDQFVHKICTTVQPVIPCDISYNWLCSHNNNIQAAWFRPLNHCPQLGICSTVPKGLVLCSLPAVFQPEANQSLMDTIKNGKVIFLCQSEKITKSIKKISHRKMASKWRWAYMRSKLLYMWEWTCKQVRGKTKTLKTRTLCGYI